MSESKDNFLSKTAILTTAGLGLLCVIVSQRARILKYLLRKGDAFCDKIIKVVDTPEKSDEIVKTLRSHCKYYRVLGFDCEWVQCEDKQRQPVALLQLATQEGLCALFRLSKMKTVPTGLRELLNDPEIIKTGVHCSNDALLLNADYGVRTQSTLDLRYMALMAKRKPGGLGALTQAVLGVELDKRKSISTSNWEAEFLSSKQMHYAANDALAGIEIFKKLLDEIDPQYFWHQRDFLTVFDIFDCYFDKEFKDKHYRETLNSSNSNSNSGASGTKTGIRKYSTKSTYPPYQQRSKKSKIFYENWLLEAPDGGLLCTLDRKKADWYLKQGLAIKINDKQNPYVVRLNFEPKGRADNVIERFYKMPRENICVVCGQTDAYIRKNVVPREYRKYFPDIMKSHSSHDIVLLCINCHQFSNITDQKIRQFLADKCDAPLIKKIDNNELQKVRSAARALNQHKTVIPEERKNVLREIVREHFNKIDELTADMITEAANIEINTSEEDIEKHGAKVVERYKLEFGGPLKLETLWREHFLRTMQPKFMPKYWDKEHNAKRIAVKIQEGHLKLEDVEGTGFNFQEFNMNYFDDKNSQVVDTKNLNQMKI